MSDEASIRVNFGRPMPVFPLNAVTLMPHAVLPVHIFEDRYRRMIGDALDGPGQIAMAVFQGEQWMEEYDGNPPIRPAVCVGQIVQHHHLPDGRYNIALHGVCRARVLQEVTGEEDHPYREAILEPVGIDTIDEEKLDATRERLTRLLSESPLTDLRDAENVVQFLGKHDVPTSAILELITFSVINDPELRYRLLAEGDPYLRAGMVEEDLQSLRGLLHRARPQRAGDLPKGCSWN